MDRHDILKGFASIGCALTLATACAEMVPLWPEGKIPHFSKHQVGRLGNAKPAEGIPAYMPTLDWHPAPAASNRTGACAILLSGGGYNNLCDVWLVNLWKARCAALGIQSVTLAYRTGRPQKLPIYQSAWEDGQRAVRLVRAAAKARGFDPNRIGVFGMSAGSHLATLLATCSLTPAYEKVDALDDLPCNINFACTCAIAYGMTDGLEHSNSRMGTIDAKLDPLFKFDKATCPMWMSHGGADIYAPNTSVEVYRRLRAMKIPAELELYPDKPHGAHGIDHSFQFLRQLGLLETPAPRDKSAWNDSRSKPVERVELWPGRFMPDASLEQGFRPYLEWIMPTSRMWRREVLVVCLAGSNTVDTASHFDPTLLRRQFNYQCMPVVLVHYRDKDAPGTPRLLAAREDIRRALKIVRSEATARDFDPEGIGILGVGGPSADLALFAASTSMNRLYRHEKPDAVEKFAPHANWAVAVAPSQCFRDELAFDRKTCPMLVLHGDREGAAVEASLAQWLTMRRLGVQSQFVSLAGCDGAFDKAGAPGTYAGSWTAAVFELVDHERDLKRKAAEAAAKKK